MYNNILIILISIFLLSFIYLLYKYINLKKNLLNLEIEKQNIINFNSERNIDYENQIKILNKNLKIKNDFLFYLGDFLENFGIKNGKNNDLYLKYEESERFSFVFKSIRNFSNEISNIPVFKIIPLIDSLPFKENLKKEILSLWGKNVEINNNILLYNILLFNILNLDKNIISNNIINIYNINTLEDFLNNFIIKE